MIAVVLLVVGTAVAVAAGIGPFAHFFSGRAPDSGVSLSPKPTASARTKPADPAQAVDAALKLVPAFKDVTSVQRGTVVTAGHQTDVKGTIRVTANPSATQFTYEQDFMGQKSDRVHDIATGRYCFTNADGKTTKLQVPGMATETDPFNNVKTTKDWRYLLDTSINGHLDWVVRGERIEASTPNQHFSLNTLSVFINSATGSFDEVDVHQVFTDGAGVQNEVAVVATDFTYDTGATIPACK
ncbi:MAG: hypothetical protein M3O87_01755 [Candidatus Dormibacteraeota bacterium]|nr:hypothetical protein [Candidatus Dormibacteraeota bacterium]